MELFTISCIRAEGDLMRADIKVKKYKMHSVDDAPPYANDELWGRPEHDVVKNRWQALEEIPASSSLSDAISKDLKKRGFKFVGTTIIYAYLQAIGVINDHLTSCFCYEKYE